MYSGWCFWIIDPQSILMDIDSSRCLSIWRCVAEILTNHSRYPTAVERHGNNRCLQQWDLRDWHRPVWSLWMQKNECRHKTTPFTVRSVMDPKNGRCVSRLGCSVGIVEVQYVFAELWLSKIFILHRRYSLIVLCQAKWSGVRLRYLQRQGRSWDHSNWWMTLRRLRCRIPVLCVLCNDQITQVPKLPPKCFVSVGDNYIQTVDDLPLVPVTATMGMFKMIGCKIEFWDDGDLLLLAAESRGLFHGTPERRWWVQMTTYSGLCLLHGHGRIGCCDILGADLLGYRIF